MALHPVKLPKSATLLFRVVGLQKKLLRALAEPALNAGQVDTVWVQQVWNRMDAEWVRKFCLGGKKSILPPIRVIAAAEAGIRQAIFNEFRKQNHVKAMLDQGGHFNDPASLPGMPHDVANAVNALFTRFYDLLGHRTNDNWNGYEFGTHGWITKSSYKNDYSKLYPTLTVCPYCDGEIGTMDLDHYLPESVFSFLSCSPWNLVPVCGSCNKIISGKGERLALSRESARPSDEWLHPFFRPASTISEIRLSGQPKDSIPELYSPDALEQTRLGNHLGLIPSLSKRWTNIASARFDILVNRVNKKTKNKPALTIKSIVLEYYEEHCEERGKSPSSMVHAAVCKAVLDEREGYLDEFETPNTPKLA